MKPKYTELLSCIQRDDGTFIPRDPENIDYVAFLDWVAEGNTPGVPPPAQVLVPRVVTMRQARLALLGAGKLPAVKAAIDALEGDEGEAARIEWEFAASVERDSPIVALLATAVDLDAAALDALFTAGAAL